MALAPPAVAYRPLAPFPIHHPIGASVVDQDHLIQIEIPTNVTIGAMNEAAGALIAASAGFIDWERLHAGDPEAISPAGHVLLAIAHQLSR
jgi:hypothetical protein